MRVYGRDFFQYFFIVPKSISSFRRLGNTSNIMQSSSVIFCVRIERQNSHWQFDNLIFMFCTFLSSVKHDQNDFIIFVYFFD